MLLLPTEPHVERWLGPLGAEPVRTLGGFSRDLLGELDPTRALATPAMLRLVARAVVDESPPPGAGELPPRGRAALAAAVDATLGRLRGAGTSARELERSGARWLGWALGRVDARLEAANLCDARAAGALLSARLASVAPPPALAGRVAVRGWLPLDTDDWVGLEALHAGSRALGGPGVTLVLPRLGDRDGAQQADADPMQAIADRLEARWAALDDAPAVEWGAPARAAPTFERAVVAASFDAEARAVAFEVARALESGVAPERIAIVVPALGDETLEPMRAALGDARVPFTEPFGPSAAAAPAARAALLLLELADGPVRRDDLIELLRAPGVHSGPWTERAREVEAATYAAALAHRLRDVPVTADADGRAFVHALARPDDADPWMARALDRLLQSLTWLRGAGTVRELGRRFLALLDRVALGDPSVGELAAALRSDAGGGAALALSALGNGARAARVVRDAARAVDDAAVALGLGDVPLSPGELAFELERAARGARTVASTAARAGAVRIAPPADLCDLEHDLLIVTGLCGGAYGGEDDTDALLPEATRLRLPAPVRPVGGPERTSVRRAELAWAVSGAGRVVVTRSADAAADDDGTPHPTFLAAVAAGAAESREPPSRLARGAATPTARAAELVALASGAVPRGSLAHRVAVERARSAFFLDPTAAPGPFTGRATAGDGVPTAHLAACFGGASPDRPIAVTAVERGAACAFAAFARRALRLRRVDDVVEEGDARERGSLLHRALAAAFEAAYGPGPRDRRAVLARGRSAAERALAVDERATALRRETIEQAVDGAVRVLAHDLDGSDALSFAFAEQRFAGDGAWGPLVLEAPGEAPVYVDGQIDRIDRSSDGRSARVVDYKTGKGSPVADWGRTSFQLPLYGAVVARELGVSAIEALYVRVRPNGAVEEAPRKASDRSLDGERRQAAARAAHHVVLSLWRGEIAPRPAKPSTCARCEARDLCRRPAVVPEAFDEESGR